MGLLCCYAGTSSIGVLSSCKDSQWAAEDLVTGIPQVLIVCFTLSYSGWLLPVLGAQWLLPHAGSLIFLGSYLALLEGLDIHGG